MYLAYTCNDEKIKMEAVYYIVENLHAFDFDPKEINHFFFIIMAVSLLMNGLIIYYTQKLEIEEKEQLQLSMHYNFTKIKLKDKIY